MQLHSGSDAVAEWCSEADLQQEIQQVPEWLVWVEMDESFWCCKKNLAWACQIGNVIGKGQLTGHGYSKITSSEERSESCPGRSLDPDVCINLHLEMMTWYLIIMT